MNDNLDYLIISPHPDDAELGVGGTIGVLKSEGATVGILDLTNGEPTPFGSPVIRGKETDEATKILKLDYRKNLGLKNRELISNLESRALLAEEIRRTKPKNLFVPFWEDIHPDHIEAYELALGARFWSKLTKTHLATPTTNAPAVTVTASNATPLLRYVLSNSTGYAVSLAA